MTEKNKVKPFLRWAGGKRWLTKNIKEYLPKEFNNYHEPFLGGASIFIYLKSNNLINGKSYLSDFNNELINAYKQIQSNPKIIINELEKLKNTKEDYYKIRSSNPKTATLKAVRFIYLNKTSFNGIYRVNLKGKYNVPYGYKKTKNLFEFENIMKISTLLKDDVEFHSKDFYSIIDNIKTNDLVFLDPPYTVAHENNGFVKYNQKIFLWEDQKRLANFLQEINNKKAYYILTNAAHESVDELFSNLGKKYKVQRSSSVGGKGASRKKVNEFIFTNIQL
ncbi:DNA adenine methylase [Aureivirga sp. CE67]|uniref:DNA adenine methylase n=1 Tax=Aureivirga sp. CE67 TaxID=1788983 RepID=UPI0018C9615C|nr:Dam family site-specific DNA-(adenine-N6)-methyltransferase [Aureivirga sp. CE67]